MSSISANKCSFPKCVACLLAVLSFVQAISFFMRMQYNPSPYATENREYYSVNMVTGLVYTCLGLLLLYGIFKNHARCVLVFLILMCIRAVVQAGVAGYFIVTTSPSAQDIMISVGFIILEWAAIYCVYLVYRDLKTSEIEINTKKEQIKTAIIDYKGDIP